MKKLIKTFNQISILILAIILVGCQDESPNLPKVLADFTYTVNSDTGVVTFINLSENATNYVWDFGDGTSSTLINPVKAYQNGTYTVVLKSSVAAGSTSTFQDDITILIPETATLPITFDGANTKYDSATFNGAAFAIVDNPDPSGTNTSTSKVGAITNSGAAFEGFYFDLGSPIDLSTLGSISMNFWSDTPIDVLIKLEEGTGAPIEATASHGGTGWETIIFSFSSADSYSRLTMFVDGPGTTAGTFYIDDIMQVETPPAPCTAETAESYNAADLNITFLTDPSASIVEDGADFQWIDNPDFNNDVNSSCKVGQITKLGSNPWDNNQINLDAKLDFNTNTGLKIKVWSARANTEVRIKLEEIGMPANNVEQFLTTSVTNAWEELTFPFTAADSNKYDKIVLFFDLDANNTDTYYFDDLALYGTGSGSGGGGGSFDSGLLINGDFETGDGTGWIGNALNVQTDGGNSYNLADVTAAGNAFDVNLSQVVEIVPDKNYVLTFDASSDRNRTILAGIGLNHDPWTNNTQTVNLTANTQPFTLNLTSTAFGDANSRVIFDMGAEMGVVVIDNVSLTCTDCSGGGSGSGGGTGMGPDVAAPTPPTRAAADVVSIYSDAYTNITVDNFDAGWCGGAAVTPVTIAGNNTLMKITGIDCHGIDFSSNRQDLSAFTHLHFDIYTTDTDLVGDVFNVKLVDFAGGSAEASALEVNINTGTTPAIEAGVWVPVDVDITSLGGVVANSVTRSDIAQIGITTANLTNVWYDNIYLYK